jgi:CHAD domain-containing protein
LHLESLEQATGEDLTDYARLHEVRIRGKRLRYAMEIFADCFASDFRQVLYPLIEQMQEILGRANDDHMAAERVAGLSAEAQRYQAAFWPMWRPGVEMFLRSLRRELSQHRQEFLRFWQRWRKLGVREQFEAVVMPAGDSAGGNL